MSQIPVPYVAGTISIAGDDIGVPVRLLDLVTRQLDPNARTSSELTLQTDSTGALFVGALSVAGGALSATNYGCTLAANGASRTYRRGSASAASPLSFLYVLMSSEGAFHVEILV